MAEDETQSDAESPSAEGNGTSSGRAKTVAGALYLPLTAVASLGLVVAAVTGAVWLAAVALGVALVTEIAGAAWRPESITLLERVGAGSRTRAMTRSIAVAVTFGTAGAPAGIVLTYGAVALLVIPAWLAFTLLMNRVISTSPPLAVRNIGADLELREFYPRARRARGLGPYVLLGVEWLTVVALAADLASERSTVVAVVVGVVGAAAVVGFVAGVALWSLRFLRSGRVQRYEKGLFDELHRLAPDAIVYMTAGAGQSQYILNQWLPAFDAMRKRGIIVVREASNVDPIGETTLPVLYAPKTRDVERLVVPSVKLAFYLANAGRNVHLQREAGIKHVFLNHGDSDKSTSANPVSRVYDEVWVAGEAAIDRYDAAGVDIPRDRYAIVGRPQVNDLPVGPRGDAQRRILYAPTFEGYYEEANYSSLEVMGPKMIRQLIEQRPDVGIVFKPHPATGRQRPGMKTARAEVMRLLSNAPNRNLHLIAEEDPSLTLYDCFAMADVLISDISSVVTDFLHTERPILVSNPKRLDHEEYRRTFPTQAASYLVDPDLAQFLGTVDQALGDDPLAEQRREMKRYVLGDLPEGPIKAFADEVDRVYDLAVAHAARVRNAFTFSSDKLTPAG